MKKHLFFSFALIGVCTVMAAKPQTEYSLELKSGAVPAADMFRMGTAVTPDGRTLTSDTYGLWMDQKPVLPVMGEIHFSRVPAADWKREIQKMKAGGITLVATYVFWNHHEELPNVYDWSGNRSLRGFLEACSQENMPVIVRVGPYCHGEARCAGIPDWVVNSGCKLRSTDSLFLSCTQKWFRQIYTQVEGLLWKQGGPVVGVQVENECRGPWNYFATLKKMLIEIGFDVPFYTRTGWPKMNGSAVYGEILPLYGDYADGFWDRSLADMPGSYPDAFLFKQGRLSAAIASEQIPNQDTRMDKADKAYPYLTCELGGGMASSYHRRISFTGAEALAMAVCKVGSGSNLPGYYMYHGGINPEGKLTTLNEAQLTPFTNHNDLPAMTYDFQAPLGEVGQPNEAFYILKPFHQFLADFGPALSRMETTLPANAVTDARKDEALRWAVRSDGKSGFVFINNYQRLRTMPAIRNVQFHFTLADGSPFVFPTKPTTIPSGMSVVFPFNLQMGGLTVLYATAQPMMQLHNADTTVLVMQAIDGIQPEVVVAKGPKRVERTVKPDIRTTTYSVAPHQWVKIVVLGRQLAQQAYKTGAPGKEQLCFGKGILLSSGEVEQWLPMEPASLSVQKQKEAAPARKVPMGPQKVALQPSEEEWQGAARWSMEGVDDLLHKADVSDALYLHIRYKGDAARLYADGRLVNDNFFNGRGMWVPLAALAGKQVWLDILPLQADYPIYLSPEYREALAKEGTWLSVESVEVVRRTVTYKNK